MMNIENIICCPLCKGDLKTSIKNKQQGFPKSGLISYDCPKCKRRYPLFDTIVDFSLDMPKKVSLAQKMMESNYVVKKYEGKSWRASWLFAAYAGITLKEEMALIKKIAHLNQDATVLDLACGTGLYTRYLAKESVERKAIGIDISWPMLRYAEKKINDQKIENVAFLHGDAHYLPLKDSSINAAICCGSLHLFSDVSQVLKELYRTIKPNGHLALAVFFAKSSLIGKLKVYWREKIYGIHSFSEKKLKELLDQANFEPAIFHAWGVWMIANGIKRPIDEL